MHQSVMDNIEKNIKELSELPLPVLEFRKALLQKIIDENKKDPRIDEPIRQQNLINEAINIKKEKFYERKVLKKPDTVIIKMRPTKLRYKLILGRE